MAQIDVFSGLAFIWAEATCWLLKILQKPYILTLHGGNLPQFARRWPGRVKKLLNSAAGVTVPSRYLLEAMHSYRSDLRLIPNSIDLRRYSFRRRTAFHPQIVWLRAFHSIYNPILAPKVIARLVEELPDIYLTMIGSDKGDGSFQSVQDWSRQSDVLGYISWPGAVPKADVPNWLSKADIFMNTSNVDNTPVSILEAMACGLCIVSTNVGGIPYLLEHERDALLVPPDDFEAMASAIRRVITEPNLANRLSQNARLKVERLDWSIILGQWKSLLVSVANTNRT